MLFICMISFQLTGALLLLLNCFRGHKKTVILNCFPGSNFVERIDEEGNCVIPKDKLQKSAHSIYVNIVAFASLATGYIIAALSPVIKYKMAVTIALILIFTLAFALAEYFACLRVAMIIYSKDKVLPYEDLEKYDIDTSIIENEINSIFKDN